MATIQVTLDVPPAGDRTVRVLQHALVIAGADPGPEDGVLGPRTAAAVLRAVLELAAREVESEKS